LTAEHYATTKSAQEASVKSEPAHQSARAHYLRLVAMIVLHFIAMVGLMYAMVDRYSNVFINVNQLYMAGLMSASMVLIEFALMGSMYPDKRVNVAFVSAGAVALVVCWVLTRQQLGVDDRQFLKSMIPHHAGAILMCKEAKLEDPEIEQLCDRIIASQREEIAEMKAKLRKHRTSTPLTTTRGLRP
jgi:uncharacterized protein (DUF305 family)